MVTRCSVMEISVLSSSVCCSACSLVFLSKCNAITGLARKYDVSHRASSHHCWRDKLCGSSTIELCLLSQTVWSLEVKIDTWSWSSHEWHWLTEYQCQKENKLEQTSQEVKKKKAIVINYAQTDFWGLWSFANSKKIIMARVILNIYWQQHSYLM